MFIFTYSIRECSNFILSQAAISFYSTTYWTDWLFFFVYSCLFKIYKYLYQKTKQSKKKPQKTQSKKWVEDLKRHFIKEDIYMANRHRKICSSLLLEKCKLKLQWGITSHQSEWLSLKSLQMISAGEDTEKKELSYIVCGNVSWCSHNGEQYGGL